jgi:4-hydroxythreonine-4-phosphate dehydrogenase
MPSETTGQALPIAVTMGEPAGIGPDVALMAFAHRANRSLPLFAVIADPGLLEQRARELKVPIVIERIDAIDDAVTCAVHTLPVLPVALSVPTVAGRPDPRNAAAVLGAIELATGLALAHRAAAVVTNPIAKKILYEAGFTHTGHTEFLGTLAERATGRPTTPVMMLASDELRVVPATVHIPLRDVPAALSTERIVEVGQITAEALRRDFALPSSRIAIAGLNPHAGEGGTIGREDEEMVRPAVHALRAHGVDASGPHSADTLFHAAARKLYDAAIAMYHDQALIPLKTLAFDTGVNVTLGLPFVRTSPDHGTAFGIAGTGQASPESFIAALKLADRLARNRARSR